MPIVNVKGIENCIIHHPELVNLYECEIGEGTKIGAFIEIGAGVTIGKRCKIESFAFIPPGIIIGDDVFVGPHACFCNTKHPMKGEKYLPTFVMNKVVIGAGAVILPNIVIGEGAVIGAGSVVVSDVKPDSVICGNPAKPIIHITYDCRYCRDLLGHYYCQAREGGLFACKCEDYEQIVV